MVRAEVGGNMVSSCNSVNNYNHTLPLSLPVTPPLTEEEEREGEMGVEEENKKEGKRRVRRPSIRLG